jgi:iron-sulfur cluster repair protein YtfE (RIC family)
MQVDPDVTVEELVAREPRAAALLRRHGIVCLQCGEPVWGTLRELAAEKGIEDLRPILEDLRALSSPQPEST